MIKWTAMKPVEGRRAGVLFADDADEYASIRRGVMMDPENYGRVVWLHKKWNGKFWGHTLEDAETMTVLVSVVHRNERQSFDLMQRQAAVRGIDATAWSDRDPLYAPAKIVKLHSPSWTAA